MNSSADVWEKVLEILGEDLTQTAMRTWFSDCKAVTMDSHKLYLYTPSDFRRDVIENRYREKIESVLRDIFAGDFSFVFLDDENGPSTRGSRSNANQFNDIGEYTFENFIVGKSNEFAHAAAKAVASGKSKGYNPLFIYGNSGLGKTHLLFAIYHEASQLNPDYNIVYVKGETFTNELISAIQTGKNAEFREKYRGANILLIDDIQFISGKPSTQEEFVHTFTTLYEANRQIVFTSDRPPHEMSLLEDRLRTRFESGLLADIQPPDYETRKAIIREKTMQMNSLLPDDVMEYIAHSMKSNIRQIEGAVKCVIAQQDLMGSVLNVKLAEQVIKRYVQEEVEFTPTPDVIISETARYYALTPEDIKGRLKTKNVALARQICMYIIRTRTNLSLNDIGEIFSRDHTTILHAVNKVEDDLKASSDFAKTVRDITSNIFARH